MRRVICMLLVLALCMGLVGTVFAAAVSSPGQGGSAPTVPDQGEDDATTTPSEDETTPTSPGEPPKTGDRTAVGIWLLVMILALLAMITILILDYKYRHMKR